jgi:hypothetical protein
MALARCILGKFLGVVCHYFSPGSVHTKRKISKAVAFASKEIRLDVNTEKT